MKKTILNIFLTILIPSFIILIPILITYYTMSADLKIDNANIDIIINENGTSKIIEEMKYVSKKEIDRVLKERKNVWEYDNRSILPH